MKKPNLIDSLVDSVSEGTESTIGLTYEEFLEKFGIEEKVDNTHSYNIMNPMFDSNGNKIGYYLPFELGTEENEYKEIIFDSYNEARYAVYKSMNKESIILSVKRFVYTPNTYPTNFIAQRKIGLSLISTRNALGLKPVSNEYERHYELWA